MIGVSRRLSKPQSCLGCCVVRLCLILFVDSAFSAEYTVDLVPGQIFTSRAEAEAAMRATSSQASHLVYDRLLFETTTEKVHQYSVPPVPATIATQNTYGAPYFLPVWQWGTTYHDSVEGAISDWWSRYQSYYYWAFPGCTYTPFYYDGRYTNHFATVELSGRCGGGGGVYGTLVTRVGSPQCPPDYTLSGDWCVISLIAQMTERGSCPISPLTPVEDIQPNDSETLLLTRVLESGVDGYSYLTEGMKAADQCLREKVEALGINYVRTGTIRTLAYQRHLREVWDKMEQLAALTEPDQIQACAALRAQVAAEKGCDNAGSCSSCPPRPGARNHCLAYPPTTSDEPPHALGIAIDVSRAMVTRLSETVVTDSSSLSDYINGVPSCNLIWGGTFVRPDSVHFQLSR